MIARRDVLMGGACILGAGAAQFAKPSRHVSLLGAQPLPDIIPEAFGSWRSQDVGDPLAVNGPGTLAAKLYNQMVTRLYTNTVTSSEVFMLLAYGGEQTNELQLHRPEVCYPAFGYTLVRNEFAPIPISEHVSIPARRLLATSDNSREGVVYWSRMGEYLPASGGEQRTDRLQIAMRGIVPDGLLSRFSATAADGHDAWRELQTFIPQLVLAVAPQWRKVLIGTERADAIQRG